MRAVGAIHSVVFGGFALHELAKRIDDATPHALLTASCGIEGAKAIAYKPMVDEALHLADDLTGLVYRDWAGSRAEAATDSAPAPLPVPVGADDPLKRMVPVAFVVARAGAVAADELAR